MKNFFIYFSVLIILYACSGKHVIRISNKNFDDEISQFQNIVLEFNNNLVPDSILNKWDSCEYISFTPSVKGKFKWEAPNELIFSPSSGFAPSTDYTAKLTPTLNKHMIKKKRIARTDLKFHTPYLRFMNINAYWALNEDNSGQVIIKLELKFNYAVDPKQLNNLVNLYINNNKVNYKIITNTNEQIIELSTDPPKVDPLETTPIKVVINKGLRCPGSKWESKEVMEQVFELPPQSKLQITEVVPGYDNGVGTLTVLTTQPVVNENLKDIISFKPSVNFTAETLTNGILIKGEFAEGETYDMTISGKLKGIFGKEMGKDYSQSITFAKQEPMVAFSDKKSIYLSSKGERNIGINIINVPRIKLTVFKIFENNIIHYLRIGKKWNYYYDESEDWHDSYEYQVDEDYGKIIYNKEIDTKSLPRKGNLNLLNISLQNIDFSGEFKGIYLIKVESTDKKWLKDLQLVSVSDIGLIVKQGINSFFVMANSIKSATPLSDVTINLISSNNQKVTSVKTNKSGIASIDNLSKLIGDFNVAMITAHDGNDFNYLIFNNSSVDLSRYEAGGKRTKNIDYDVFIYGPRDIYRPGDSVYFNTVLRTFSWNSVPKVPIKIKILLPNGKDFQTFRRMQNSEGASEIKFLLPNDIMTGMYSVDVYSGNDVLLKSTRFSVEEFMPDRISVKIKTDKTEYKPEEKVNLDIIAKNLFGPPAANRNVETELSLARQYFEPKNLKDYNFNIVMSEQIYFKNIVEQGKTNDEGLTQQSFELPDYKNIGIVSGKIYTTVFDETGRPVNRLTTFNLYTQDVFYGIKYSDYWVTTKKPIRASLIAVNKNGNVLNNISAKVVIKKYLWENVLEKSGNSYHYNSQKREEIVYSKNIIISGSSTFINYTPANSGEYEIMIMNNNDESYVSEIFYAYGWGDTDYSSFEISKEGEVKIESDKEKYKAGETAKILFKTPFPGKIIVTVERDRIFENYTLTTDNKAASLNLPVRDDYLPNIYISATAIREIDNSEMPLTVAHGYLSLNIENPSRKLSLKIEAVDKSRSQTKQNITIRTEPNTELTVAVVDEGILQVTNFKTPDIYGYFYEKRALEVDAYDLYPYVYPELRITSQRYGGDQGDLTRRVNPISNKRVKLVSRWSGILKSNANGICTFPVTIPQFSGALRIMAVVYKDQKFASDEHIIKVADPIVISTALPRFLSPKDIVTVPVTLTNTTNNAVTSNITISTTGFVEILDERTVSIKLKPNGENQVKFRLQAKSTTGQANIKIIVNGFNQTFTDETDITIRPAASLLKITDAGMVKGGQTGQFTVKNDFISPGIKTKLLVSKSPIVEFCKDITWLLEYPYGCAEQTISKAFPLIYYRDLAKAINQDKKTMTYNPDFLVQQAIYKIEAMQIYNGGITIWPSGGDANWWVSAYAAHFLYEAKQAGFDINIPRYENILQYLKQRVKQKDMEEYLYFDEKGVLQKLSYAKREIFYSLYVLALNGKQNLPLMNYYKSNQEQLTWDSKFMLACTYALIGDKFSFKSILPSAFDTKKSYSSFGGCYYSDTRDIAIAAYTLIDVDPDNKETLMLIKHLSESLRSKSWYSTQERAFGLMALGKFAKKNMAANVHGSVMINGKASGIFTGKDLIITEDFNNKTVLISNTGTGNLFYFYEASGISASGKYKQEDSYMKVRRNFYDRFGHLLSGNNFSVNDLIVVKITGNTSDLRTIDNVAITDILPACFEIENPRISPEREFSWIKDKAYPEYTDIRDDRISFFTSLSSVNNSFYYMVRVVSKGEYQIGPIQADAMYNGEYHSYNGGGLIIVR